VYWARYHIQHLRKWRDAVRAIAKAVHELNLNAEVYVIGGAAENRLTVLSDVDVVICFKEEIKPEETWNIRKKVLALAMDKYGLPWDYPVEVHVLTCSEFTKMPSSKRAVKVEVDS